MVFLHPKVYVLGQKILPSANISKEILWVSFALTGKYWDSTSEFLRLN